MLHYCWSNKHDRKKCFLFVCVSENRERSIKEFHFQSRSCLFHSLPFSMWVSLFSQRENQETSDLRRVTIVTSLTSPTPPSQPLSWVAAGLGLAGPGWAPYRWPTQTMPWDEIWVEHRGCAPYAPGDTRINELLSISVFSLSLYLSLAFTPPPPSPCRLHFSSESASEELSFGIISFVLKVWSLHIKKKRGCSKSLSCLSKNLFYRTHVNILLSMKKGSWYQPRFITITLCRTIIACHGNYMTTAN